MGHCLLPNAHRSHARPWNRRTIDTTYACTSCTCSWCGNGTTDHVSWFRWDQRHGLSSVVECWHLLKDPHIFWAYHASGTVGLNCLHGAPGSSLISICSIRLVWFPNPRNTYTTEEKHIKQLSQCIQGEVLLEPIDWLFSAIHVVSIF